MRITLLRVLRQIHEVSLQDLAEACEMTAQRISLIELNRANPSLEQKRALATFFGVPSSMILTRVDNNFLAELKQAAVDKLTAAVA